MVVITNIGIISLEEVYEILGLLFLKNKDLFEDKSFSNLREWCKYNDFLVLIWYNYGGEDYV